MPHATETASTSSTVSPPSPVAAIRAVVHRVVEILGERPYQWMEWEIFLSEWYVRTGELFPGPGLGNDLTFLDGLEQSHTILTYWTELGQLLVRLDPSLIQTVEAGGLVGAEPSNP